VERNADQSVKETVAAPSAQPEAAPDVAPGGLNGFAAAMGNQAFNAYIARSPRLVPTAPTIARDPPTKPDPADATADGPPVDPGPPGDAGVVPSPAGVP
jgi:hypothetical protein